MRSKVSKYMSYVLRHKPEDAGLTLDEHGWVSTDALLAAVQKNHGDVVMTDIHNIVQHSEKKRFQIAGSMIRASQGHSVPIDLNLEPSIPPMVLYHGTKREFMPWIMKQGLSKGARHHVHLSATIDTAKIVADRRAGESVILAIDTAVMEQEFFLTINGVWLTEHVAPRFLTEHS